MIHRSRVVEEVFDDFMGIVRDRDINEESSCAAIESLFEGVDPEEVKLIVNMQNENGITPLRRAISTNALMLTKYLVNSLGADVNEPYYIPAALGPIESKHSLLEFALLCSHVEIAKVLYPGTEKSIDYSTDRRIAYVGVVQSIKPEVAREFKHWEREWRHEQDKLSKIYSHFPAFFGGGHESANDGPTKISPADAVIECLM